MKRKTKLRIWSLFESADQSMLKTSAQVVDVSSLAESATQQLIDDMIKTMNQANGIGLAAPQIGQSIRLAVVSGDIADRSEPFVLVNPIVSVVRAEQVEGEEGCLSIPGVFGIVPRAANITLKAFDRHGQPWTLPASELLARVIQHEVDHLNGILFLDRAISYTKGQEKLS